MVRIRTVKMTLVELVLIVSWGRVVGFGVSLLRRECKRIPDSRQDTLLKVAGDLFMSLSVADREWALGESSASELHCSARHPSIPENANARVTSVDLCDQLMTGRSIDRY